ncbi:MAG: hypothetical protein U0325_20120 [Polyangiales bacterium]
MRPLLATCARAAVLLATGACATAQPARPTGIAPPPTPTAAVARPLSASLEDRVRRVEDVLRARGAVALADRWSAFIPRGALRGFSLATDRPQCLGFVGVSPEGVADLDLFVLDAQGAELARDDRADAHPYARVCSRRAGERLHVFARAAAGSGEVAVLVVTSPPLVAPPLDDALGGVPTGLVTGPRTPRGAIGADPHRPAPESLVDRLLAPYLAQAWSAVGAAGNGRLRRQEVGRWTLPAEEGRCYLVQGVGGDGVDDLDLVVHGPDGAVVAQDVALDATPAVRFCAEQRGEHPVEVRMYAGSGAWAVRAVEAPTPRGAGTMVDLDATGRARHRELVLDAESRGMAPAAEPVRGAPWGSLTQTLRMPVEANRCYLVGAAADAAVVALDVWVSDPAGAVLASDTAERERATVYHCARRAGELMIHVRTATARGSWVLQTFTREGGA